MKNRLFTFVTLTSCVMLTGCGNKETPKIEFKAFPTDLVIGSTIDLSQYISVSGGTGGYSINFDDESFAKVSQVDGSNTTYLLEAYGDVKFNVKYSGISSDAAFNVGSKDLNEFISLANNAGYKYTTMTLDQTGSSFESFRNYGENYYIDQCFQEKNSKLVCGGMLKASDEKVYSFLSPDMDDNLQFQITGYEFEDISVVTHKLSFPETGYDVTIEKHDGKSEESYSLLEDETGRVSKLFEEFFGYSVSILAEYSWIPYSIDFFKTELTLDKTAIPVYVFYANILDNDPTSEEYGTVGYIGMQVLSFDQSTFFNQGIEKFISDRQGLIYPESSYELNIEDIKNAVNNSGNHNFEISYTYNWYSINEKTGERVAALNKNPFVNEETEGYYINEYLNAFGEFTAYVTEDQTLVELPASTAEIEHNKPFGLVKNTSGDQKAWMYAHDGSKYVASSSTNFAVHDPVNSVLLYNFDFLSGETLTLGCGAYDKLFINEVIENKKANTVAYKFNGSTAPELFNWLFKGAVDDGVVPAYSDFPEEIRFDPEFEYHMLFNTLSKVADFFVSDELYIGLQVTLTETIVDGNITKLVIDYCWEDELENPDYSYTPYEYAMTATIEFGDCEIPADAKNVVFDD